MKVRFTTSVSGLLPPLYRQSFSYPQTKPNDNAVEVPDALARDMIAAGYAVAEVVEKPAKK